MGRAEPGVSSPALDGGSPACLGQALGGSRCSCTALLASLLWGGGWPSVCAPRTRRAMCGLGWLAALPKCPISPLSPEDEPALDSSGLSQPLSAPGHCPTQESPLGPGLGLRVRARNLAPHVESLWHLNEAGRVLETRPGLMAPSYTRQVFTVPLHRCRDRDLWETCPRAHS